jgi:aspartyl aminopeptidase
LDDAPLSIPQLAIHLDRDVNEKGLLLNKQDHLVPLAGLHKEKEEIATYLEKLLRRRMQFKTLYSFDLFLVPLESARFMGADGELLTSFHLDNLSSAHASAVALATAAEGEASKTNLSMAMFWDHEEIGSCTSEGAASPFLHDVLRRIGALYNFNEEAFIRFKTKSLFVSIDVAHGFNPNYKAKYEPHHLPLLGRGIVLKYNADQKYASTGPTAAAIARAAEAVDIPYQSYVVRSDIRSGSTVGPVVAHQLGIPTVDIGIPLLSMHSIREIIACRDHLDMCTLLTALLQA